MKKKLFSLTLILIVMLSYNISSFGDRSDAMDLSSKKVLFISSYSPSYETFFYQVDGLKSILDANNVVLGIEFMDSKRFHTKENYDNFYQSLKYKLENGEKYDSIIVGDDNALIFVKENEELFVGQPIIFLGVNDITLAEMMSMNSNMTGIVESVSFDGTFELAKQLQPNANRVVALTDCTTTGQAVLDSYKSYSHLIDDFLFETIDLSDLTFEEFSDELSKLSPDDIVILLAVHRDVTGRTVTFSEGVSVVTDVLDQPVYTLYEFGLGTGLVGGEVVSYFDQGQKAGEIVIDIFNGESIESIKLVENRHIKMLDYFVIEEYNLCDVELSDDVIYINTKENMLVKYFPYILISLVIIVLQYMLIFYLYRNIKFRKGAEEELLKKKQDLIISNDELKMLNEEMFASNEELRVSNEKLSDAVLMIEEQNREIYDLIYLDDLTKLKNRKTIFDLIDDWLNAPLDECSYAILFLDVDNFKLINDTFGHDYGDKIIVETGKRLSSLESKDAKIGRFGGDEFLIIHKSRNVDTISDFLSKLESLFNEPFSIDNRSLFLTISIGVAICPIHGNATKELVKKADMALYEAKKSGKNRFIIYDQNMIETLEDKVLFQSHVRKAFNNREFYMNYQPYFDIKKGCFTGAEALIRWNSVELGFVSPLKLIQASEEMGLIVDIGRWVIENACLFSKNINDRTEESIVISINISSVQMLHPSFISDLEEIIHRTEVNPKNICFEMTETTLFEFTDGNELIIDRIRSMGVEIALDDFGTGYSSLSYFKDIPASILKIDKVFIDNITSNKFDRYTAQMIVNLAHYKNLLVIAEGVEDQEQAEMLKQMECDIIQGYYYSKPLVTSEAQKLLLNENE